MAAEAPDPPAAAGGWNDRYKGRDAIYDNYIPILQLIAISLDIHPDNVGMDNPPASRKAMLEDA